MENKSDQREPSPLIRKFNEIDMDVEKCLNKYSDDFYSEMYGMHPNRDKITSLKEAKEFLAKYAMDSLEYENKCVPVMRKIFLSTAESYFDIKKKIYSRIVKRRI